MTLENILFERKEHIAILTINRPPANTWNLAAMLDLEKALDAIEQDTNIRVVMLTGAGGKCFSAGYDVSDAANAAQTGPKGQELFRRVDRLAKPIIAVINGHALGGGLELALCCHFRLMADSSKIQIGLTELNLGIIPGWGGTQRLMRVVGKAKALDMILFSKRLGAAEALQIGLVNQLSRPENLMEDAMNLAETLATRPPIAVAGVLKALSAGIYEGMDQGLLVESESSRAVSISKDAIEGFAAFLEKRTPSFKGE